MNNITHPHHVDIDKLELESQRKTGSFASPIIALFSRTPRVLKKIDRGGTYPSLGRPPGRARGDTIWVNFGSMVRKATTEASPCTEKDDVISVLVWGGVWSTFRHLSHMPSFPGLLDRSSKDCPQGCECE